MRNESDDENLDLSDPEVLNKYKTAAEIANRALTNVIAAAVPERKILDLCQSGDQYILNELKARYPKEKFEKGVAFPTCVSVNNCAGHYSPLSTENKLALAEGDLVKIDLGVHIDGYIVVVAHTIIATNDRSVAVKGRKADAICAAHFAAEAALRLLKPGKTNTEITQAIQKAAEAFKCSPVEGVLSHQISQFVIDGQNVIINKPTNDQKVAEFTFEENEVYGIDIVISSGEGKTKELETRTTIFKRSLDQNYLLKLKASRFVFNEITRNFSTMPFTLRALSDEKRGRLGISECLSHGLVLPYPVLYEKPNEVIAQFKFTALLLPTGTLKLSSHELPFVSSEYSITDPTLLELLSQPINVFQPAESSSSSSDSSSSSTATAGTATIKKKKKSAPKKKKKAAKKVQEEEDEEEEEEEAMVDD